MEIIANRAAARSYFEDMLNHGNMSAADAIFTSEVQFHYPLGDLSGADAVKAYIAAQHFPTFVSLSLTLLQRAIVLRLVGRLPVHRLDRSEENRLQGRR